ncbi:MAG TPA: hypothetical protein VHR45_02410 [Thermoanaerobaculia bacterium]|nr:hypothetical protein [Thermoanaerobaculia bacterium]
MSPRRRLLLAASFYLVLSMLYLRPIWQVFGTHIAPHTGDPLFNLYLLQWGSHQLRLGMPSFWDAPFYYPARHVITYSDHLLGPSLIATAFTALVPNALAAYNFLLLASFVLCGFGTYYVLIRRGVSATAALLAGCVFAFSPFRWEQLSHLQVLLMQWIPLTLWSFDRLLEEASWHRATLFLLFYLLHISGGNYLAYMIHVPLLVLLGNRIVWRLRSPRPQRLFTASELAVLSTTALAAAAALAALYAPYVAAARQTTLSWTPGMTRVWGASALSYLTPSPSNLYSSLWPESLRRPENSLFPGWLPSILAACGLADLWRRHHQARGAPVRLPAARRLTLGILIAVSAAGFLLAELHTWSLQAPALGRLVPGGGYRLPRALWAGGLLAWLLLRRRWRGSWPRPLAGIEPWTRGVLLAGALSALLALPMVYAAARGILPGLTAMRVPARFNAFTSFAIAYFAALGFDGRLAAWRGRRRTPRAEGVALASAAFASVAALAALAALLLLELTPRPISWVPLPAEADFPAVYSWLRRQPAVTALLELPLREENEGDLDYMHYGTLHWKPLVNGYSARMPHDYEELRDVCCWPAPESAALAMLRRWRVSHVLIHTADIRPWGLRALPAWEASGVAVRVYADEDGDLVYHLLP